jgi:diguanylate cyclase (GGDEF)-like protein
VDRLTGMHTREYLMVRLIQEIERANRYESPLSLLMIDIDSFKLVNDQLGHQQGDAVLKMVARLIKKEVRAIDLVGRYGGEEFVVLLPETGYGGEEREANRAVGALVVAGRIRKSVDEEFRGLRHPLNVTISIGVAVRYFPQDRALMHQDLIRIADEQLYRAKTTGKNRVCSVTTTDAG